VYDETGEVLRTAEEEFIDGFGGGNFRDRGKQAVGGPSAANLSEQLTVRQVDQSHTAGFEAWMRSRGQEGVQTFTSDDIINQFGVVKGSYEPVPLPKIKGYTVRVYGSIGLHLRSCLMIYRYHYVPYIIVGAVSEGRSSERGFDCGFTRYPSRIGVGPSACEHENDAHQSC
jgi:hypothetical protein